MSLNKFQEFIKKFIKKINPKTKLTIASIMTVTALLSNFKVHAMYNTPNTPQKKQENKIDQKLLEYYGYMFDSYLLKDKKAGGAYEEHKKYVTCLDRRDEQKKPANIDFISLTDIKNATRENIDKYTDELNIIISDKLSKKNLIENEHNIITNNNGIAEKTDSTTSKISLYRNSYPNSDKKTKENYIDQIYKQTIENLLRKEPINFKNQTIDMTLIKENNNIKHSEKEEKTYQFEDTNCVLGRKFDEDFSYYSHWPNCPNYPKCKERVCAKPNNLYRFIFKISLKNELVKLFGTADEDGQLYLNVNLKNLLPLQKHKYCFPMKLYALLNYDKNDDVTLEKGMTYLTDYQMPRKEIKKLTINEPYKKGYTTFVGGVIFEKDRAPFLYYNEDEKNKESKTYNTYKKTNTYWLEIVDKDEKNCAVLHSQICIMNE